ncbi:MAG: flagellar hook-length control protein FliK [Eubacterium sp.]|nr:flagellar hook-length control protein FliK [Eubacterium sp.]
MNQVNLLISSLQNSSGDMIVQQTKEVSSDLSFANLMNNAKESGFEMPESQSDTTYEYKETDVKESYEASYKTTDNFKSEKNDFADEGNPVREDVLKAAEKITDAIEEELGVTEEEVTEALETLGLTYLDLLTTGGLSQVVAELTGSENASELLVSSEFTNILSLQSEVLSEMPEQVQQLLNDFELYTKGEELPEFVTAEIEKLIENVNTDISENGINLSISTTVSEEGVLPEAEMPVYDPVLSEEGLEATEKPENIILLNPEKVAEETNENGITAQMPKLDTARENITSDAGPIQEVPDEEQVNIIETNASADAESDNLFSSEENATKQTGENLVKGATEEASTQGESEAEKLQSMFEDSQSSAQSATYTTQTVTTNQDVTGGVMQTTTTTTTYIDPQTAQNIISQVTENVFLQATEDSTTMELQLNPENLGKLYVSVTTKEGEVSAQLQTQNEAVKAALESQINVLKETLAAQGIKVTEVEVTVASHEFEENLEKNQAGAFNEDASEGKGENSQTQGRRNINLGELDSLSGLMSEEEALIAKIMSENGNTMDLTA